jgi:hypothetical protein
MRIAYVLGFVGAGIVVGCGIGGTDSLFASGSAGGGAPATGGGAPGTGGTVGTVNPVGGGQGGSPSTTSHASSSQSSSAMSSSEASSAMSSSSTGGMQDSVTCGDMLSCPVNGTHACCWDQDSQNDQPPFGKCVMGSPGNDGCATTGGPGGFHARITCDSPHQCPGGFCCGHRILLGGNSAYYDAVSCQAACDDPNVRLCDPNDNTQTCPMGSFCQQSGLLPNGYFVCL